MITGAKAKNYRDSVGKGDDANHQLAVIGYL